MTVNYGKLPTEQRQKTRKPLDTLSTAHVVAAIHKQDLIALMAVGKTRHAIAAVVDDIALRLARGGRLIYVGAGTSGRLGVLDAAECPPTFNASPKQIMGIIAGGKRALTRAVEGAEDDHVDGARQLGKLKPRGNDFVCGITASGVTPFVLGALRRARATGCGTALITCGSPRDTKSAADHLIHLGVGPEILTGSTRMKSGLATKAVLHTITTATMVRLGKVYDNLMVDVQPTNQKLRRRAQRIVAEVADISLTDAARFLSRSGYHCKTAIVMARCRLNAAQARKQLKANGDNLRTALTSPPASAKVKPELGIRD